MRRISSLAFAFSACLSIAEAADTATFVVPAGGQVPAGFERIADYTSYSLYRGSVVTPPTARGAYALADADVLQFDRLHLDTQRTTMRAPPGFSLAAPVGAALHLVQFVGPIKDKWLDQVRSTGAVPIHYIESNGYLVWAGAPARDALARLVAERQVLQYSAPFPSFIKLGTSLFERLQRGEDRSTSIRITLQLYRHAGNVASKRALEAMGLKPDGTWTALLAYENAHFNVTLAQARAIIEFADVVWVGEVHPRSLHDEVQAQIIRGNFNAQQSGPQSEGYLQWLDAVGFPSDAAAYPLIDITDDGVGNRTTTTGDPSLHAFGDALQPTRVAYNVSCGNPAFNGVVKGHGHLDASIAVGYDVRANATTPGARFPGAYQRGLGMNPYGRIGATRIFNSNNSFDITACGDSETGLIRASYLAGARISNNSWGCNSCAGQYDDTSQAYDVGTRDADLQTPGNQQLITFFSAGNNGSNPGTVSSPGNGKNMITVGAAENQRTVDENGNWNDGCGNGPTNADNAMDIVGFSGRGPSPGARAKPEFVAPGTHITGTRATPGTGTSLCDGSRPSGNATYAASSGTSHATPALAGVASLVYWWIANDRGALAFNGGAASTPAPALIKAWMMAHPTYLTGVSANDNLPSNAQGFGMPNLQAMFGDTPTYVVNQTQVLTDSGQIWTWTGAVADPSKPLRIALAWTDAAGAIGASPQVNNLDLDVQVGATSYRGNRFSGQWSIVAATPDNKNNYEAVYLPAGTNNTVTIRVSGFNIAGDGVPGNADATDQDFALVCSNCMEPLPDLLFADGFDAKPER